MEVSRCLAFSDTNEEQMWAPAYMSVMCCQCLQAELNSLNCNPSLRRVSRENKSPVGGKEHQPKYGDLLILLAVWNEGEADVILTVRQTAEAWINSPENKVNKSSGCVKPHWEFEGHSASQDILWSLQCYDHLFNSQRQPVGWKHNGQHNFLIHFIKQEQHNLQPTIQCIHLDL